MNGLLGTLSGILGAVVAVGGIGIAVGVAMAVRNGVRGRREYERMREAMR